MKELDKLRKQIDKVDGQLIDLLSQRQDIAKQIGNIKKELGEEPFVPSRWEKVLKSRTNMARLVGLEDAMITQIWNILHEFSIKEQA